MVASRRGWCHIGIFCVPFLFFEYSKLTRTSQKRCRLGTGTTPEWNQSQTGTKPGIDRIETRPKHNYKETHDLTSTEWPPLVWYKLVRRPDTRRPFSGRDVICLLVVVFGSGFNPVYSRFLSCLRQVSFRFRSGPKPASFLTRSGLLGILKEKKGDTQKSQ